MEIIQRAVPGMLSGGGERRERRFGSLGHGGVGKLQSWGHRPLRHLDGSVRLRERVPHGEVVAVETAMQLHEEAPCRNCQP